MRVVISLERNRTAGAAGSRAKNDDLCRRGATACRSAALSQRPKSGCVFEISTDSGMATTRAHAGAKRGEMLNGTTR